MIFAPIQSERIHAIGLLAVRIGISFTFFWASYGKITNPSGFGVTLQNMAGIDPAISASMALTIGILELVSGIFVLTGFLTRPAALFQIVILLGAMVMFGFDFTKGPAIWKDPAILGIAICLSLLGSGKFGIDHIVSKRLKP